MLLLCYKFLWPLINKGVKRKDLGHGLIREQQDVFCFFVNYYDREFHQMEENALYIDKVRKVISEFDRVEYEAYLIRLHRILKERYEKNLKPSVLRKRVDEFKNGTNSSLEYFEAYLLTFDEMVPGGTVKIFQSQELEMVSPLQPLMHQMLKNKLLSKENTEHLKMKNVNDEIEALLYNIITYCSASHPKEFAENLHLFNQVLNMKKGRK